MSLSEVTTGTQTAVIGTEHVLAAQTTAAIYSLLVDVTNMAAGDVLELRAKIKVLSTSTERLAYLVTLTGDQTNDAVISIPIPTAHSTKFTLKQISGTGRAFDWSVVSF